MQTIQIEIEDPLYKEILKKGIDIKKELEENIRKIVYTKEYKMAEEIKTSLQDLKEGKSRPLNEVLNEIDKEEKLAKLKKLKQYQDLEFAELGIDDGIK